MFFCKKFTYNGKLTKTIKIQLKNENKMFSQTEYFHLTLYDKLWIP